MHRQKRQSKDTATIMLKTWRFLFIAYILAALYLYLFRYMFCNVSETGPFGDPRHVPNETDLVMEERRVVENGVKCPYIVPGLTYGPIRVNTSEMKLVDVENKYKHINIVGGRYSPPCRARHQVAIIVPYRDREAQLPIFLNHMHPFLVRQQIEYGIYIVEQMGTKLFNRGKLLNVGFAAASRLHRWPCYVFHDVDLLPQDSRLRYSCALQPRHLSHSVDTLHYMMPYRTICGGVIALTHHQFTRVNGFSNNYWGWGGEDDDFYYRIRKAGYKVSREKPWIGKYKMLPHKKAAPNPIREKLIAMRRQMSRDSDGLSGLQYRLHDTTPSRLYTRILVDID